MKRLIPAFALIFLLASCTPAVTPTPTITFTPTLQNMPNPMDTERLAGMEIGNKIVFAIEQYHEVKGRYPDQLSDLVPQYLESIPITSNGQEYQFYLYQPEFINFPYALHFYGVNGKWGCAYHRKYEEWECSTGTPP